MSKKDVFKEMIRAFQAGPPAPLKERALKLPLDSGKIITVSGVRRSGKTSLLLHAAARLLAAKVPAERIIYVNFEDERLDAGREDLDLLLQACRELNPEADLAGAYFFFDEIQNIDGWEKFTRRVYDTVSRNLFVTGSNSRLLSTDIATSLRGRSLGYEVYPLTFAEYLAFTGLKPDLHEPRNRARIAARAQDYLRHGGFPELAAMSEDLRLRTLQGYFDVMLFKDLIERCGRRPQVPLLKYFIKRLFAGISSPVSLHKIYNELRSQGYRADKNLLYALIEELRSIYFFFPLRKYSESLIKREASEKKYYVVDNGLAGAVSYSLSEDRGKLLENAVFMQFQASGAEVYFYKNGKECDFICQAHCGKPEAIQAAYTLADAGTKEREIAGLIGACRRLRLKSGAIVTMSDEFEEKIGGIAVRAVPFYKWALK